MKERVCWKNVLIKQSLNKLLNNPYINKVTIWYWHFNYEYLLYSLINMCLILNGSDQIIFMIVVHRSESELPQLVMRIRSIQHTMQRLRCTTRSCERWWRRYRCGRKVVWPSWSPATTRRQSSIPYKCKTGFHVNRTTVRLGSMLTVQM